MGASASVLDNNNNNEMLLLPQYVEKLKKIINVCTNSNNNSINNSMEDYEIFLENCQRNEIDIMNEENEFLLHNLPKCTVKKNEYNDINNNNNRTIVDVEEFVHRCNTMKRQLEAKIFINTMNNNYHNNDSSSEKEEEFKYIDKEFPANNVSSMGYTEDENPKLANLKWKRLYDYIHEEKQSMEEGEEGNEEISLPPPPPTSIFIEDPKPCNIKQSNLADCYFIAALSSLSNYNNNNDNDNSSSSSSVEQNTSNDNAYNPIKNLFINTEISKCGCYGIRLFHNNQWHVIIIDDYVPFNEKTGSFMFGHTIHSKEIWLCLLEKAYAKLYGSYAAIEGGNTSEALRDLTGCPVMDYNLFHKEIRDQIESGVLWNTLSSHFSSSSSSSDKIGNNNSDNSNSFSKRKALMGCAMVINPDEGESAWKPNRGIYPNHAYSVINMISIQQKSKKDNKKLLQLVIIRNPLSGSNSGYKGIFSNKKDNNENNSLPNELSFHPEKGEIIMEWNEFCSRFNRAYICLLNNNNHEGNNNNNNNKWLQSNNNSKESFWNESNAGGSTGFPSWKNNPLFKLHYNNSIDRNAKKNEMNLTFTLSQVDIKREARKTGKAIEYFQLGITILKMNNNNNDNKNNKNKNMNIPSPCLTKENYEIIKQTTYWNKRDVSCQVSIPLEEDTNDNDNSNNNTTILVIPSTFMAKRFSKFWISCCQSSTIDGMNNIILEPFTFEKNFHFYTQTISDSWNNKDKNNMGRVSKNYPQSWKNPKYKLFFIDDNSIDNTICSNDNNGQEDECKKDNTTEAKETTIATAKEASASVAVPIYITLEQEYSLNPKFGKEDDNKAKTNKSPNKKNQQQKQNTGYTLRDNPCEAFEKIGIYVLNGWKPIWSLKSSNFLDSSSNKHQLGEKGWNFTNTGVISRCIENINTTLYMDNNKNDNPIIIMPTTFDSNKNRKYKIQIYCLRPFTLEKIENKDIPAPIDDDDDDDDDETQVDGSGSKKKKKQNKTGKVKINPFAGFGDDPGMNGIPDSSSSKPKKGKKKKQNVVDLYAGLENL